MLHNININLGHLYFQNGKIEITKVLARLFSKLSKVLKNMINFSKLYSI